MCCRYMERKNRMKSMALPRSLKISIAVIICLNILVFLFLGISIHKMSENTIENIGTAYMAGMNEQVALHFETIIELRLTMVESIAHIAADEKNSGYGSREEIEYGARARQFMCVALYSADGKVEMIYGDPVESSHFCKAGKTGNAKCRLLWTAAGTISFCLAFPVNIPCLTELPALLLLRDFLPSIWARFCFLILTVRWFILM